MGLVQGESMSQRFFHRLGASLLDRTICASAGTAGHEITLGSRIGMDMEVADQAKLIIFWGCNAITSSVHFWARAQQAKRLGARLIAIDPYRSLTAEKCHTHIALLPGTDAALALGLMHVLIRDDLIDHDYVSRHTLGFDELCERVESLRAGEGRLDLRHRCRPRSNRWPICTRRTRPALIRANYGLQRVRGGGMAMRNIACLPALVGAFRDAAGGVMLSTSGNFAVDERGAVASRSCWARAHRAPSTCRPSAAHLRRRRRRFARSSSTTPIRSRWRPDSARVARGFAREDLFTVVLEHFHTDTADYADIVLPATTQLEHLDVIKPYGHYYMVANNPAIRPLGEAKPNTEIFRLAGASAMGFSEPCFEDSDETIAQVRRRRVIGISMRSARRVGSASVRREGRCTIRRRRIRYPIRQGGVLLASRPQSQGLDPLPDYIAPLEDTRSELAQRFPLAMISPPARNFLNSSFVNVASLRASEGEPWLDIHPEDAAAARHRR